jgi:hypothetical protein
MELFTLVKTPYDGKPVPQGDGLAMLLRRLELVRLQAGRPTYRQISRSCDLSASTVCRIFTAKKPPAWDNLRRVLKALDIEADTSWRELWLNAENDADPIPVELGDGLIAPGRRHCSDCGTWIADEAAHAAHHQRIEMLADNVAQLRWQVAALVATRNPLRGEPGRTDDRPDSPPLPATPSLSRRIRPRRPTNEE